MANLDLTLQWEGHRVRMAGTAERPEWIAKDACRVLGLTTHNAGQGIPDAEKGHCAVVTPGGPQSLVTVTEGGLYRLISRSRKPSAQRFQQWLFNEVLPSIREHGCYPPPAEPALPQAAPSMLGLARHMLEALEGQERQLAEHGARIARIEARAEVAAQDLLALPEAPVTPPEKSFRAQVNERVRAWGAMNCGAYQEAWTKLKRELYYRCHFDAVARVRNSKRNWLDEVESADLMRTLYAISCEVLPNGHQLPQPSPVGGDRPTVSH